MTFPLKQATLCYRNIWNGDTVVTQHMTLNKEGMTNIKNATNNDKVMETWNKPLRLEIYLESYVIRIETRRQAKTILNKDVTILPNSKYNLFSLMKAVLDLSFLVLFQDPSL